MKPLRFPVDVILERVPVNSRWVDAQWRPAAVVPVVDATASASGEWSAHCERDGEHAQWRFAGGEIELHPTEAEGYYLNLSSPQPVVFVMWRVTEDSSANAPPVFPVLATVSYNEAARFLDAGEHVDPVTMPPEITRFVEAFVAAHYRPEPRRKARRNDPFAENGDAQSPEAKAGRRS